MPGGLKETMGSLDGENLTGRADNLGEIHRCITWTGADVHHLHTDGDAGPAPALEHGGPPDAMLQPKPGNLLVMGSEHIIFVSNLTHDNQFPAASHAMIARLRTVPQ